MRARGCGAQDVAVDVLVVGVGVVGGGGRGQGVVVRGLREERVSRRQRARQEGRGYGGGGFGEIGGFVDVGGGVLEGLLGWRWALRREGGRTRSGRAAYLRSLAMSGDCRGV